MNSYYREGIRYANSEAFAVHIGNPKNVTLYPISHKDAYLHLDIFLKERFAKFGKYQDAIMQSENIMYHSNISAPLNIGLLDPLKVVEKTRAMKVPLESYEGFIRQLIGWREYMHYLYVFHQKDLVSANLPENDRVFRDKTWYNGTTGHTLIDNEIKKAIETGYAHHIVRLMIFMNFFILCGLKPQGIYKWFMEVVSIDAYDWVMTPNIYAMGYFSPMAMSRPYLSTSSYIAKMSNYSKDGKWDVLWDSLFYLFISSKPKRYVGAYARNLGYLKRNPGIVDMGKLYIKQNFIIKH